jgi:hypothetical protein
VQDADWLFVQRWLWTLQHRSVQGAHPDAVQQLWVQLPCGERQVQATGSFGPESDL